MGRRAAAPRPRVPIAHSAWVLGCVLVTSLGPPLRGAERTGQPLFAAETPLELRLEGPFGEIAVNRDEAPELPGTLRYRADDGREIVLDVRLAPRGLSRLRNCTFPPLRIGFDTTAARGTVFEGQDKLKLVTHCMRGPAYSDVVAREYQIYRLYNALTDYSLRVRWLSIEYVDVAEAGESMTAPAFLIEEDWAAGARLGLEALEVDALELDRLERSEAALLGLFHYMIGNADWSLRAAPGEPCCHNGKVLAPAGEAAGRFVLPYDFDQAAFVDAGYAVHNLSLGLRGDQRLYRGYCAFDDALDVALTRLAEAQARWLAIVGAGPVSENARVRDVRYIERAYKSIQNPRTVERRIRGNCRVAPE